MAAVYLWHVGSLFIWLEGWKYIPGPYHILSSRSWISDGFRALRFCKYRLGLDFKLVSEWILLFKSVRFRHGTPI